MAQHDYDVANGSGLAVRTDLNNALAAIVSNNSGSTEPSTTFAFQWWADTNANLLKIRNSSNNGWVTLMELDGTQLLEDGSASTPGLAFADDLNTGLYSPGSDQIGLVSNGAERLRIDNQEVIVNEPSNDVDFRVESNGNTHMFHVDAGNNRIGIGEIGGDPSEFIEARSAAPHLTFHNTTHEDTDGGRETHVTFKGEQSGGEISSLAQLKFAHEGTADDTKGEIVVLTNNGTALNEQVRIQHDGKIGLSVQSPAELLDISGNIQLSASNPLIRFNSGGPQIKLTAANELSVLTSGSKRVEVDNNGDVNIRDFSPRIGASLTVGSTAFTSYFASTGSGSGNIPMIVERHSDNGIAIEFKRNTSVVGNISVTATNTAYNTSSDYRLKENIVDLDGAINRVKQLQPRRFNFIADADTIVDGFVAHEAATVVPEAVTGTHNQVKVWEENDELPDGVSVGDNKLDEDGNTVPIYQGIDQSKLVPLLTAALQEAISEIETLKTKVAALEAA